MTAAGTGALPLARPGLGRTIRDLAPLIIVLLLLAAVEWYLITEDWLLATWILAAFLVIHGLIHFMFLAPAPARSSSETTYPFDPARSWPVRRLALTAGGVRGLAAVLASLIAIGYFLAGLATIGLIVPTDWWGTLVVASSILSIVLMALMASPSLVLGVAVDVILLWLAWSGAWTSIVS